MQTIAMKANFNTFKAGMISYDVCNAQTFQAANTTLQTTLAWTETSLRVLEETIFPFLLPLPGRNSTSGKVLEASDLARAWVDQTFERNGGTICGGSLGITEDRCL